MLLTLICDIVFNGNTLTYACSHFNQLQRKDKKRKIFSIDVSMFLNHHVTVYYHSVSIKHDSSIDIF